MVGLSKSIKKRRELDGNGPTGKEVFKLMQTEKNFGIAASRARMDQKTVRKYRRLVKLPSELKQQHTWRTRNDPFENSLAMVENTKASQPKA